MHVADSGMHPTIKRCLQHLEVIKTDDKTRQIVYMYMQSLYKELTKQEPQLIEQKVIKG
ncbi:hypothetical protein [Peribacillus saganii]|uniref:hypothetical protein n=1 Tax=Peribacillus saganii TaxID=2303992 RepID=UPI0013149F7E|nr:hypothetical protein [Peribacillus saganii]